MNKSFRIRDDWLHICILPAIRKRNYIAVAIWVFCLGGWLYSDHWIFAIIFLFSLVERIYENATIGNTKKMVGSISISVSDSGITMKSKRGETGFYHPWPTLTFNEIVSDDPLKDKIILKSKNSTFELFGYENQQLLRKIIHEKVSLS